MQLSNQTILITGGATGIGGALAQRFLEAGSEVIVCGRREDKLREARERYPRLRTLCCDVAQESERIALLERAIAEAPGLNVLINNAGIQRRGKLTEGPGDWSQVHEEIAINLEAPVHLAMLFVPHLKQQAHPAIINVSSGLAFTPMAGAAVYSATKAALHSFTMSLRLQVAPHGIDVLEVIPPAVQTDLGGAGIHIWGVPLDEFSDAVMQGLARGDAEIAYGTAEKGRTASRAEIDEAIRRMASLAI